jgi:hypothetical protein
MIWLLLLQKGCSVRQWLTSSQLKQKAWSRTKCCETDSCAIGKMVINRSYTIIQSVTSALIMYAHHNSNWKNIPKDGSFRPSWDNTTKLPSSVSTNNIILCKICYGKRVARLCGRSPFIILTTVDKLPEPYTLFPSLSHSPAVSAFA